MARGWAIRVVGFVFGASVTACGGVDKSITKMVQQRPKQDSSRTIVEFYSHSSAGEATLGGISLSGCPAGTERRCAYDSDIRTVRCECECKDEVSCGSDGGIDLSDTRGRVNRPCMDGMCHSTLRCVDGICRESWCGARGQMCCLPEPPRCWDGSRCDGGECKEGFGRTRVFRDNDCVSIHQEVLTPFGDYIWRSQFNADFHGSSYAQPYWRGACGMGSGSAVIVKYWECESPSLWNGFDHNRNCISKVHRAFVALNELAFVGDFESYPDLRQWMLEGPDPKGVDSGELAMFGRRNGWLVSSGRNWNAITRKVRVETNKTYRLTGYFEGSSDLTEGYFGLRFASDNSIIGELRFGAQSGDYTPRNQYRRLSQWITVPDRTNERYRDVIVFIGYWSKGTPSWLRVDHLFLGRGEVSDGTLMYSPHQWEHSDPRPACHVLWYVRGCEHWDVWKDPADVHRVIARPTVRP
ncbi:hypothetical protein [Sorangium atrum]|uniref:Uncharacterized protein n=1 Tax=Sorangium atrum TaxID=2995308 RepID=A0ABT5BXW6_9BACT|nr:hypothetical protein [Sorangium aterium]MDC0678999.1 hypothetical protein [Sorangium aterium]